ncbi:MAG: hypothetical protein DRO23_09275 [Thermoprotei archaeon]|nr:hypothetical protein [Candidatus Baldrarchaeota archaeon]RLG73309.1 MAG: hypothetical protein DRO23_09275 [Thermoprotei archaeon]
MKKSFGSKKFYSFLLLGFIPLIWASLTFVWELLVRSSPERALFQVPVILCMAVFVSVMISKLEEKGEAVVPKIGYIAIIAIMALITLVCTFLYVYS